MAGNAPAVQPASPPPNAQGAIPDLTVNDAWEMFGFPQKRALRADAKKRYQELALKHHPDLPGAAPDATDQLKRVNRAWALLQKHCRW